MVKFNTMPLVNILHIYEENTVKGIQHDLLNQLNLC